MSVGLIDDGAVVACNGVTECDQAIIATAVPIPMVPVEKKTLRMTASVRVCLNAVMMDQSRFRTLPSPSRMVSCKIRLFRRRPGMSAQVS